MKLKRYLTFSYDAYYPGGGWSDFVSSHDTIDEAMAAGRAKGRDYVEVIDLHSGEQVADERGLWKAPA